jgi:hypothetical protein
LLLCEEKEVVFEANVPKFAGEDLSSNRKYLQRSEIVFFYKILANPEQLHNNL